MNYKEHKEPEKVLKRLRLGPYATSVTTVTQTVNLSNNLSYDVYSKLTNDDICIEPSAWTIDWRGHSGPGHKDQYLSKSYNPSNGVLTFSMGAYTTDGLDITWGGTNIYVHVFYLE